MTEPQSKTVSPLNVDDSCTIENIEVHCKNGRYCLHNDAFNKSGKAGATEKYIRCRFFKYPNDTGLGFAHTIGFGLNRQRRCEYIGCEFYNTASGRAFYGHTWGVVGGVTLTEAMSGDITVTDCIIDTNGAYGVYLANATSDYLHIRVLFASCYISKKIAVTSGGSDERRNAFDLILLNSGNPVIEYSDVTNPYEPNVYPPEE